MLPTTRNSYIVGILSPSIMHDMNPLTIAIAAAAYLPSAAPFAPTKARKLAADVSSSTFLSHTNNDNNSDALTLPASSSSLQHKPSPFLALLETDDWKEWHYSFARNGLTDFLPQFSDHISCMMIGADGNKDTMTGAAAIPGAVEPGQLPWQVDSDATSSITNVAADLGEGSVFDDDSNGDQEFTPATTEGLVHNDRLNQLVADTAASMTKVDKQRFDCILDGGVMNAVISSLPATATWHSRDGPAALLDLHSLMQEANRAIREHGIYVAVTDEMVPQHAKEYLSAMGEVMGMEWTFDLDGLSNAEYSVSVARKFFNGLVNLGDDVNNSPSINDKHMLKP